MFINLKRVEFVVTYACSGKCKHCSVGEQIRINAGKHIAYNRMKGLLVKLSSRYKLDSIMCFGGEPLLYADDVCNIIQEAKECNIEKRQIITNGYFSKTDQTITKVSNALEKAGITHLLLSVDAFHQETIPIEPVYTFAKAIHGGGMNIRVHPAWVVNKEHPNEWNRKTLELLSVFETIPLKVSSGNNIFPSGNAIKYLADFYPEPEVNLEYRCGQAPYTTELNHVDTISIEPDGTVSICGIPIGNCYSEDILDILDRYNPYEHKIAKQLIEGGIKGLIDYAKNRGITIEPNKYHSPCSICKDLVSKLER